MQAIRSVGARIRSLVFGRELSHRVLRRCVVLFLGTALVAQLVAAPDRPDQNLENVQPASILITGSVGDKDLDAVPGKIEAEARQALIKLHDLDPNDPRVNGPWADDEIRGLMFARLLATIATSDDKLDELDKQYYRWFQHLLRDVNASAAQGAIDEYNTWKSRGCGYTPPSAPEYYSGLGCRTGAQANTGGPITASRPLQPTLDDFRTWGVARSIKGGFPDLPKDADIKLMAWASATVVATIGAGVGGVFGASAALSGGILFPTVAAFGSLAAGIFGGFSIFVVVAAIVSAILFVIQIVEELQLPQKLQDNLTASRQLPDIRKDYHATEDGKKVLMALFLAQIPPQPSGGGIVIDTFDPSDPLTRIEHPDRFEPEYTGSGFNVQHYTLAGEVDGEETLVESQVVKRDTEGRSTRIYFDRGWIVHEDKNGFTPTLSLDYLDWDYKPRRALIKQDKWYDAPLATERGDFASLKSCEKAEDCPLSDTLRMLGENGRRFTLKNVVNHAPPPVSIGAPIIDDGGPDCVTRKAGTICRPPPEATTLVEGGTLKLFAEGINADRDEDGDPITYRWTIETGCPVKQEFLDELQRNSDPTTVQTNCVLLALPDEPGFNGPTTKKEGAAVNVTWTDSGTRLVKLEAFDGRGLSSVAYRSFKIDNVAPTLRIASSDLEKEKVSVTGCIDDPGGAYEFPGLTADWGDGNVVSGPASGIRLKQGEPAPATSTSSSNGYNVFANHKPNFLNPDDPTTNPYEKVDLGMTVSLDKIEGCNGTYSFKLTHTYAEDAEPPEESDTFPVTLTTSDGDGGSDSEVLRASGFSPVDVTLDNIRFDAASKNAIFRVTFGELVTGFDESDLVFSGTPGLGKAQVIALRGEATAAGSTISQAAVTVPVTSDGPVTISIPAGAARAGRKTTAAARPISSGSDTMIVDLTKPTVRIASTTDALTRERGATFTLDFSEPVNGLSLDDLELSGTATREPALLVGSTGSTPGQRYVLAVPVTSDGTVSVALKGGGVRDLAGNTADAASSDSVEVDQTVPTVAVDQANGQADPTNGDSLEMAVEFSEPVEGLVASDFLVWGSGEVGALELSGSGKSYRLQVPVNEDGTFHVALPAGATSDRAGNLSAASNYTDRSVTVDRAGPEVLVSRALDQADPTQEATVRFRVLFSEQVSGFDVLDVSLSGTASHGDPVATSSDDVAGSNVEYTVTVPVTSGGTITLSMPERVATDAAGNPSIGPYSDDATVFVGIPPKLIVKAHNKSREYGAPDPKFTVTSQGFINGEGPDVLGGTRTCASTAEKTSPVGNYPITCSGITADTYQIVNVPGTLKISKAPTSLAVEPVLASTPNVSARLTLGSDGQPLEGNRVSFRSGSTVLCSAVTDADGVATCAPQITGTLASLVGGVAARFNGTGNLSPSTGQSGLAG